VTYIRLLENIILVVRGVVGFCEITCLKGGIISELIWRPQIFNLSSELVIVELSVVRLLIHPCFLSYTLIPTLKCCFLLWWMSLILILVNGLFVATTEVGLHNDCLVTSVLLLYGHTCIKGLTALHLLIWKVMKIGSTSSVVAKELCGSYHRSVKSRCINCILQDCTLYIYNLSACYRTYDAAVD
jgi:hypothetical protein